MKWNNGGWFRWLWLVLLLSAGLAACTPEQEVTLPSPTPTQPSEPDPDNPADPAIDKSRAAWRLTPDTPTLAALVGDTAQRSLELTNIGLGAGTFELEVDRDWLLVSPMAGRLESSETTTLELSAECLSAGSDTAQLIVKGGASNLAFEIKRSCDALPRATLELSKESLVLESYTGRTVSEKLTLSNTGTAPLEFDFDIATEAPWLVFIPTVASLAPGDSLDVELKATCPASAGEYRSDVKLASNDPEQAERILEVTLNCAEPADIELSVSLSEPFVIEGLENSPGSTPLTVTNNGSGLLSFETETEAPWLRVEPPRGEVTASGSAALELLTDCTAQLEPNPATLVIRSNDPDEPTLRVTVNLICLPADAPKLVILEPNPLLLETTVGQTDYKNIQFKNEGASPLEFTLSASESWLDIDTTERVLAAGQQRFDLIGATCGDVTEVRSAMLTLTTNDPVAPVQTIPLELTCGMPPQTGLQVVVSGEGSGKVSSQPVGIDCGSTCQATFTTGTDINLRAEPAADATFTGWVSGPCAGKQGECSFTLDSDVSLEASFSKAPAEGFSIVIRFSDDNLSPTQRAVFERAAARWAAVITTDLPDFNVNLPDDGCWQGVPAFQGTADDLIIDVTGPSIDGVSGILGRAGPCKTRPDAAGRGLPYFGAMQLDKDDLDRLEQRGTLEDLILHEMGHVLGIGTLWQPFDLLSYSDPSCQEASSIEYKGTDAVAAYESYGAGGFPPVETEGGPGTKCAHWDNARFDNELMTGYLNNEDNALSRLSIGTLEDLGYSVNYGAADDYVLPVLTTQSWGEPLEEVFIKPQ